MSGRNKDEVATVVDPDEEDIAALKEEEEDKENVENAKTNDTDGLLVEGDVNQSTNTLPVQKMLPSDSLLAKATAPNASGAAG